MVFHTPQNNQVSGLVTDWTFNSRADPDFCYTQGRAESRSFHATFLAKDGCGLLTKGTESHSREHSEDQSAHETYVVRKRRQQVR